MEFDMPIDSPFGQAAFVGAVACQLAVLVTTISVRRRFQSDLSFGLFVVGLVALSMGAMFNGIGAPSPYLKLIGWASMMAGLWTHLAACEKNR